MRRFRGKVYGETVGKLRKRLLSVLFVFYGLFLLGCSPKYYPISSAKPLLPELFGHHFMTEDGTRLPLTFWSNTQPPQAIVIAVHGFNDYQRAFDLPADFLAKNNIYVYAYDQRGFGEAANRGAWLGGDRLQSDLLTLVNLVIQKHPTVPIYLLGDSMGGAVVTLAATAFEAPKIAGVILNAPAVWGKQTFNSFYRVGLWLLAHTLPWMEVTGSGLKITVTDNIPLLRELSLDPLMIRETRIDALYGLVGMMDTALERAPLIKQPTLLVYGLKDEVIPQNSICHFASQLTTDNKVIFYEHGYHFLLRDLDAQKVWQDIVDWIEGKTQFNEALAISTCELNDRKTSNAVSLLND